MRGTFEIYRHTKLRADMSILSSCAPSFPPHHAIVRPQNFRSIASNAHKKTKQARAYFHPPSGERYHGPITEGALPTPVSLVKPAFLHERNPSTPLLGNQKTSTRDMYITIRHLLFRLVREEPTVAEERERSPEKKKLTPFFLFYFFVFERKIFNPFPAANITLL